jgi:hypothetical protein
MFTATPRQGYLLVLQVKNPWGENVGTIDISAMHTNNPCGWNEVVESFDNDLYPIGSFVYVPKQAAEAFVMGEKTAWLVHHGQVKYTGQGDEKFKVEYVHNATVEVQNFFREKEARRALET